MLNYYEILGVDSDASTDEIKKAYRKLVRKLHPDVQKITRAKDEYEKLMATVNVAYEILSDASKRRVYDAKKLSDSMDKENKLLDNLSSIVKKRIDQYSLSEIDEYIVKIKIMRMMLENINSFLSRDDDYDGALERIAEDALGKDCIGQCDPKYTSKYISLVMKTIKALIKKM